MRRKILSTAIVTALMCAVMISSVSAACDGGAVINADSVNFRASASTDSAVKAVTTSGTPVVLQSKVNDDWYRVIYNGTAGYIASQYLNTAQTLDASFGTAYINGTGVRLRSGASTTSSILGTYDVGVAVSVTGVNGSWYKVVLNGVAGYVSSDYVSFAKPDAAAPSLGQQIADTASEYVGYRYVYGGSSPSGFDCSGLVKYVYGLYGYTLDRTAAQQSKNGVSVERADIQPGDIICFNNGGYIGHVGIYVGEGNFVHASGTGVGVITTNLDSSSYNNRVAAIRRIV